MHKDVYGRALTDHYSGRTDDPLLLYNNYGFIEEMPVDIFFRSPHEFPDLEHIALALCDGKTLDIGAGAGSHALQLQEDGMDITALEISASACEIMRMRGVKRIVNADIFEFSSARFDTLLLLMNGIGLVGELAKLPKLLNHFKKLLKPGGQLLFDSSNIEYLYEDPNILRPAGYHGEVQFQYEYRNEMGAPFKWLYIDQDTLIELGQRLGWVVQILYEDGNDQYLARMEIRS